MRSAFLARFPECEFFFVLQDPGCFFHFLLFFVLLGDPQASRSFACRVGAPRGVLFSMLLVLPRGIFHFFGFASRMPWFKIIHSVRARVHGSLNILHLKGCFLLATWQSFRTSSYFGSPLIQSGPNLASVTGSEYGTPVATKYEFQIVRNFINM